VHGSLETQLLNTLDKFLRIEEVSSPGNKFTTDEMSAEQVCITMHRHDATGRYVVQVSLKVTPPDGNAILRMALGSLHHMHGRFNRDPAFANDNPEFTETYKQRCHIDGIPSKHLSVLKAWYLPHHTLMLTAANKKKFGLYSMLRGKQGILITKGIL
jgi:hypothetical protein